MNLFWHETNSAVFHDRYIMCVYIYIYRLSIRNVAYIGLRSVDSYERLVIEKFGISAFGMEDVERFGNLYFLDWTS